MYDPFARHFGGFSPNDGTIDFYFRINQLANPAAVYLDYGAGRAAWFEDSESPALRNLRLMKGKFAEVIAVDVDPVVAENRTADRTLQMQPDHVPLPDQSVDVIVADYVIEHVQDPASFAAEVDRLLKPGGWFCARTPHKAQYIALAERLMTSGMESAVLRRAQPKRKEKDVFEKAYRMNTLQSLRAAFPGYDDRSFCRRCDPAYFFGSRASYGISDFVHRVMPAPFSGNIFVFMRKPGGPADI
jgi:SAM-dependent methyltransferase